jgi:hypothetical protein
MFVVVCANKQFNPTAPKLSIETVAGFFSRASAMLQELCGKFFKNCF